MQLTVKFKDFLHPNLETECLTILQQFGFAAGTVTAFGAEVPAVLGTKEWELSGPDDANPTIIGTRLLGALQGFGVPCGGAQYSPRNATIEML